MSLKNFFCLFCLMLWSSMIIGQTMIAQISPVNEPDTRDDHSWNATEVMPIEVGLLLEENQLSNSELGNLELRDATNNLINASFSQTGLWHNDPNFVKWLLVRFISLPGENYQVWHNPDAIPTIDPSFGTQEN